MTTIRTSGPGLKATIDRIAAGLAKAKKLRAGFLEGSTEADGTSIPMIAAIQNFGAPSRGIPPRPFFSNLVRDKAKEWPDQAVAVLKANGYDASVALHQMGEVIQAEIKDAITATNEPPLSPVTVMLRGMRRNDPDLVVTGKTVGEAAARVRDGKTNYGASTKPLIDSGDMQRSVAYDVET